MAVVAVRVAGAGVARAARRVARRQPSHVLPLPRPAPRSANRVSASGTTVRTVRVVAASRTAAVTTRTTAGTTGPTTAATTATAGRMARTTMTTSVVAAGAG